MTTAETLLFLSIDAERHALLSAMIGEKIKHNALLTRHVRERGLKEKYCMGMFAEEGTAIVARCDREIALCEEMLKELR